MASGGVTYALQESCSALRSYSAGGLHRSSAQFIRQSEHHNKRCDIDTSGRPRSIASTAAPRQCDRPNRVRVFQFGTLDAI